MTYTQTTFTRAIADVAARLSDPLFVRWSSAEIGIYVTEALRTWNALTGSFHDQGTFNTAVSQPFYDLSRELPALLGYHVTDQDLITEIEYHLLEPPTPTVWTGTDQFALQDVVSALQRRRDQFLLETGMVLTRATYPIAPPPDGRIQLDQAIVTVRRVAWRNTDSVVTPLNREDVWNFTHFAPRWIQTPGRQPVVPSGYSVGETPPLVLQIAPPPSDTGVLDLVSVVRGATLGGPVPVLMGIPDDMTWICKWGALADLLNKDGLAMDAERARYCEERWKQGIQMAKTASSVWAGRIQNQVAEILSLTEADDFSPGWQTGVGTPQTVLMAGRNLVALTPVPDMPGVDLNYSVTLDVVRNAPIPLTPTDFLQVGPELLDAIYGYAVSLALTKEGLSGITDSQGLVEQFFRMAGVDVGILTAQTPNRGPLTDQTKREESHTERMVEVS